MTIKFLGIAPGAGEMDTEVLVFARTKEFSNLEKIWAAFDAAKIWANLFGTTKDKIYIEFNDFVSLEKIEKAIKEASH